MVSEYSRNSDEKYSKIYMGERESMRMKNFIFKSSNNSDLQKFSLTLNIMQKQLRDLRDDQSDIKRRLTRVIGLLTDSTPVEREEEYPEEEIGTNKDIPEGA